MERYKLADIRDKIVPPNSTALSPTEQNVLLPLSQNPPLFHMGVHFVKVNSSSGKYLL